MSLIGKLIKSGIELNHRIVPNAGGDQSTQEEALRKLLRKASETAFGKYYGFDEILQSRDVVASFKESVPIFNYDQMHQWWRQQQKYPDITWPGKPRFFALSSGTTGKESKRIPITEDFLSSMRDVGTSVIRSLPNFDLPEAIFESEILMLSSSAKLDQNDLGFREGEISGINVSNFPNWYDTFYRPGKEIAAITDWDERVNKIAEEAPNWNIGAVAGIPSWVLLMLQKVVEKNGVQNIHEVWPNFTVYSSGGVAFETYRADFEAICGKEITVMDTYLASEGFVAYTARPDTMAMELALEHGYFYEFIPFDERGVDEMGNLLENPESLQLNEVKTGQDYVLVLSTCAGAWRYQIGDVIKFTSLQPYEIKITGRTKFFLNVVGSQLSEEKMDDAILKVSKKLNVSVNEYSVAAIKNDNGDYIHQWVVVSNDEIDSTEFKSILDDRLMDANKNYKVAREKALKDIDVRVITKSQYKAFLAEDKKVGGQVKTPKVMDAEKMDKFLNFISS